MSKAPAAVNRTQNAEMGPVENPVLPTSERQIRPLLTDLQHDGERAMGGRPSDSYLINPALLKVGAL